MRHQTRAAPSPPRAACAAILFFSLIIVSAAGVAGDPVPMVAQGLSGPLGAVPDLTDLSRPLRQLVQATAGTRAQVAVAARASGVQVRGGMVQVVVVFQSPADAAAVNLAAYGAQVQIRADRRVQALVPVDSLGAIADLREVATVRQPYYGIPLQASQGTAVSEGVQLTNASVFHQQTPPISGAGVTVAVVDQGFTGYVAATASGDLPLTVGAFEFAAIPPGIGLDNFTVHGTGVAEIVHDMAPDAAINLMRGLTMMEVEQAVAFATTSGADVAVMSLGWPTGPFDGTSTLSQAVTQARDSGVFFAVACGNHAQRHWEGSFVDSDGDGFHEFLPGDEGITVNVTAVPFRATLSWWDTAGTMTAQDYDIVLRDTNGTEVARSAITQDGDDEPIDQLFATIPPGTYELQIDAYNINPAQVDHLELFSWNTDFDPIHQVTASSVLLPADAEGAFTVGATRGVNGIGDGLLIDDLELFSSHGPTNDGRMKPNLSAPDYVSTVAYGTVAFPGTSAAAPHVAGAAALMKSEDLSRDRATLELFLKGLSIDLGTPGPDNQFGEGRLSLRVGLTDPPPADGIPPVITILAPLSGSIVSSRQPTITGSLQDTGSGIDESTIVLTIDGVPQVVAPGDFDAATGTLTFTSPIELAIGAHVVALTASDVDGNPGNTATVGFRISLPMIGSGLRMVSLPFRNLATTDPVAIFGRPLTQIAIARWLPDDTAFNKYHIFPDPFASFEPPDAGPFAVDPTVISPPAGLGYFVRLNSELALDVDGDPVSSTQPYVIKLRRGTTAPLGWNMIGTPFNAPVGLATAEFVIDGVTHTLASAVAAGATNGVLYTFVPDQTGGGFYTFTQPLTGTLEPLVAYWVHVMRDIEMRIFPVITTSAAARSTAPATAGDDGWRIQLSAVAGGHQDPVNFAGVSATAAAGADSRDIMEPPPITKHVSLHFPHADWGSAAGNYAQDVLPRGAQVLEWPVVAATDLPNTEVTVHWDLADAPRDLSFVLTDMDAGRTVAMRTTASYSFVSGADGAERHFQLRAQSSSAGSLRVIGLSAEPTRGPGATLSFELSVPANVTVELRNVAGRLVRRLATGQVVAGGRQTVAWDGRAETGAVVAPGVYLCRVAARAEDGQKASGFTQLHLAR